MFKIILLCCFGGFVGEVLESGGVEKFSQNAEIKFHFNHHCNFINFCRPRAFPFNERHKQFPRA